VIIRQERLAACCCRLGLEVGQVDVAAVVAGHGDDVEAAHLRRGRVGAVRRFRDQADVARALAVRRLVAADRDQAGVLALRAGVRLHADGVEAGDRLELPFEAGDQFEVALRLVERGEGVHLRELGPGDGNHLGGGVELHGAGAERDHGVVQRQVAVLQALQIAQHAVLGVVGVEHRMGQDRLAPLQRNGDGAGACRVEGFDRGLLAEDAEQGWRRLRAWWFRRG
jgi:hypothetical protein